MPAQPGPIDGVSALTAPDRRSRVSTRLGSQPRRSWLAGYQNGRVSGGGLVRGLPAFLLLLLGSLARWAGGPGLVPTAGFGISLEEQRSDEQGCFYIGVRAAGHAAALGLAGAFQPDTMDPVRIFRNRYFSVRLASRKAKLSWSRQGRRVRDEMQGAVADLVRSCRPSVRGHHLGSFLTGAAYPALMMEVAVDALISCMNSP